MLTRILGGHRIRTMVPHNVAQIADSRVSSKPHTPSCHLCAPKHVAGIVTPWIQQLLLALRGLECGALQGRL